MCPLGFFNANAKRRRLRKAGGNNQFTRMLDTVLLETYNLYFIASKLITVAADMQVS